MPRCILAGTILAAIAILARVSTPFSSGPCKVLFSRCEFGCGAAVLFLWLGLAGPAVAQPQCDQRDAVLAVLQEKYKESPVALGVTHNGGLVEVLTTGNGNTWSIIVTTPQGMSCLVAAGEGWRSVDPAPAGERS